MKEIVTVKEAAAFLRKHPATIRHWIEAKILRARKLSVGKNGIYAIARSDLLELMVAGTIERKLKEKKKKKSRGAKTAQVQMPF